VQVAEAAAQAEEVAALKRQLEEVTGLQTKQSSWSCWAGPEWRMRFGLLFGCWVMCAVYSGLSLVCFKGWGCKGHLSRSEPRAPACGTLNCVCRPRREHKAQRQLPRKLKQRPRNEMNCSGR
jgi:hypothetical protein